MSHSNGNWSRASTHATNDGGGAVFLEAPSVIHIGSATIHPERYEVRVAGRTEALTPLELRLLQLLVRAAGRPVSRTQILDACHSEFVEVTATSVSRRVQRLRKKLGPAGNEIITVHGVGYMLRRPALHTVRVPSAAVAGGAAAASQAGGGSWSVPRQFLATKAGLAATVVLSVLLTVGGVLGGRLAWTTDVPARAEVVSSIAIAFDAADLAPTNETFRFPFGGIGSGIDVTSDGRLVAVSGAGPQNAPIVFQTRLYEFQLQLDPRGGLADLSFLRYVPLRASASVDFVGSPDATRSAASDLRRFDPEGIRQGPTGTLFIADEYGPALGEFDVNGTLLRALPVPAAFQPTHAAERRSAERRRNRRGRVPGRGFTAVALSANGRYLYTTTQVPLIQDGGADGQWLRILEIELASNRTRQFAYRLHGVGHHVDELVIGPDGRLLVLEQSRTGGTRRPFIRLYAVTLDEANDVSQVLQLRGDGEAAIRPAAVAEYLDLAATLDRADDWDFRFPVQGVAFLPAVDPAADLLLVAMDNQFEPGIPSRLATVAIPRSARQ
jgi:DNA-binding winged helix-turn-helix (wHTH) protein